MRRLLVYGGRDFRDRQLVYAVLDEEHARAPIAVVIHGAAKGTDSLADAWASERGVERESYRAEWEKVGRIAGPLRNAEMISAGPSDAVEFPGGRGTRDMHKRVVANRIQLRVVAGKESKP